MFSIILRMIGAAALCSLVAACVSRVSDDTLNSPEFAASGAGIVVMYAPPPDPRCGNNRSVELGTYRAELGSWKPVKVAAIAGSSDGGDKAAELILPPGEYGVLSISCFGTDFAGHTLRVRMLAPNVRGLGAHLFGDLARDFTSPLATFSVRPGEVVNVGAILSARTGPTTFAPLLAPLPPGVLASFQATKPTLAEKMVTRPMVLANSAPLPPTGAAPSAPLTH